MKTPVVPAPVSNPAASAQDAFQALASASRLAKSGLRRLLALQVARSALRLGFAATAAMATGQLIMGGPVAAWLVAITIVFLLAACLAGFAADRAQASAEAAVSIGLRELAGKRLDEMPARQLQALSVGGVIMSMQRHPEAVAALVVGHRAAGAMMAAGPLLAAATVLLVSWQAALLVICLTPVMILFFALIGDAIRRRADAQERAFGRLAGQFADRIRTLPTILANHAVTGEEAKLARRLEAYADNTMGMLRIAFANAGIIDFFTSLSIAILAVFLGLGHLKLAMVPGFSNLELWQSLFILMIAPEYFAPFRRFSEQYHAKAEGLAAADALDRLLDAGPVAAKALPVLDRLSLTLPARGLVAIVGPSGSGKSTLLRRLADLEPRAAPIPRTHPLAAKEIAWISTDAYVPEGTLAEAIAWNAGAVDRARLEDAAGAIGLLDDALLPGGLDARLDKGGANLSGGQRLRIAVARARLCGRTVLADEPTAKLDRETAEAVRRMLLEISRARLVVVATHDRDLAAAAEIVLDLARDETVEVAA
ncbi:MULTISPECIES: ATP-binding cassette domain-containing protein [unclassified Mesorhizobium]|uniref:ATP-binding cassette domain-containing protein n=1 Tax=unclassified Mesorhizobium TaxID=325217 RepID=UPI00112D8637|nr:MULTISPECIES: ATP-binding cassette domain-containing protein [unclassified Mesorhizobium]TPL04590.1 ATP-binding cassette domain-containing protein [Mesorhizobium sp. B2-4-16]TPL76711.1 ATP-binding cassette domain-containing protein [Mesorhizobium sp. B2-4-3]